MIRHPDPDRFDVRQRAYLVFVKSCLRAGRLGFSEWAVRDPWGRRIRVDFDRRVGPPTAPERVGR